MSYSQRRPQVAIPNLPPGAARPVNPSPSAYTFQRNSPPAYPEMLSNPWDSQSGYSPDTPRQRTQSMAPFPSRHSSTIVEPTIAFPTPQVFRSTSARPTPTQIRSPPSLLPPMLPLRHSHSRSELVTPTNQPYVHRATSSISMVSSYDSNYEEIDQYSISSDSHENSAEDFGNLSIQTDGIQRFQSGKLPENEQEWHKLVPDEAREALGKDEVQRQSVIFELFKAEREYVADLEAIKDLYISGLKSANPPIIESAKLANFIYNVFGNLDQILSNHQRILGALFARQREQHPLVQSVADIVLDTVLREDFRSGYETYIKHYPLSESFHRTELKRNPGYQHFLSSNAHDPRIKKRDLITFLSRPVTRLPRFNLLLQQILKLTPKGFDHPDLETLPIIIGILTDFVKSTQPGIQAAEGKVQYWAICESLVFQKGEIIDLDLYHESRSLVHTAPVYRRTRSDTGWSGWVEHTAILLDHYFLLTKDETRPNGVVKRFLVSRPLPLSYLRLGSFAAPAETRKERAEEGVLASFRSNSVPIYPFTVYHSFNFNRRYTLCAPTEANRKKWHSAFADAAAVHKARQEGNMFFDPQILNDRFFRQPGAKYNPARQLTGRVTCGTTFRKDTHKFLVVGCMTGVFVSVFGQDNFKKVLNTSNPTALAAIQGSGSKIFDKLLVHSGSGLFAYSLDLLGRLALGQVEQRQLQESMEKIAGSDANIVLFRYALVGSRALVIYASKKTFQSSLSLYVLEVLDISEANLAPKRPGTSTHRSFRQFGETGYIPKDAYDIVTTLMKTIGVCTNDGIVIMDPTNLAKSAVTIVPDFANVSSNAPQAALKARIDGAGAKPLGLIRCDANELLVVYSNMGCYITKHGAPSRSCGYIKWESEAQSYAHRGANVLLFSGQGIEIRNITNGRLVQVVDAVDLRLLHVPPLVLKDDAIIAVMRGDKDDQDGVSDKIVHLVETSEIRAGANNPISPGGAPAPTLWDEWDM